MRPFDYTRPSSADEAVSSLSGRRDGKYLAGGTNLIDLMKMGVEQPARLIDVTRLPFSAITEYRGGVRIGAMSRNRDAASHPLVRERYPVLAEAILAGASPQIRNMATMGGNLMQRTRCYYFYDPSYQECNKRTPGSGCAAIAGYNRIHAILGTSEQCIAVHPSDMAVALMALDAVIQVTGPRGNRSIPIADFYHLPGSTPQIETDLAPAELITSIDLPPPLSNRSHYLKVRDRNSFAFALVSVAVVLDLDGDKIQGNRIRQARIALGGVAPKPWRRFEAEQLLAGQRPEDNAYRAAAEVLVRGAKTYRDNAFKVELARRSIVRALNTAAAQA